MANMDKKLDKDFDRPTKDTVAAQDRAAKGASRNSNDRWASGKAGGEKDRWASGSAGGKTDSYKSGKP
jgi:hypothetical protein